MKFSSLRNFSILIILPLIVLFTNGIESQIAVGDAFLNNENIPGKLKKNAIPISRVLSAILFF